MSTNHGGARGNRSPLARPTVKRIELDEASQQRVKALVKASGAAYGSEAAAAYVNNLVAAAWATYDEEVQRAAEVAAEGEIE